VGTKLEHGRAALEVLTRPIPSTRVPDLVVTEHTNPQQANIYRPSGDYNPLHIDPEIARVFGFEKPFLHGICTLGIGVRVVVETFLNNEASLVRKVGCRFSKPTFGGARLKVEMWHTGTGSVSFRMIEDDNQLVVVDQAYVEFVTASNSIL
jgi:acyl dehydratase